MFEEGLRIPPSKLHDAGRINRTVLSFIAANSRLPDQVVGDLQAQTAANNLIAQRIVELLREYGLPDLKSFSDDLQSRAEKAVRERIRAVPDGDYEAVVYSDGAYQELAIAVKITVSGDAVHVDYAGTAGQVRWGINAPFNLTRAETLYALRLAFAPDIPVVEGAVAPFTVEAPEGCVLNPRRPAPTMIRVTVVQNVYGAIFLALSRLVPEHIKPNRLHAHFGGIWAIRFRGVSHGVSSTYRRGGPPQINTSFTEAYFFNGGGGALACADGHSTISMPVNCANIPIEIMETRTPIMFEHKRIATDSGGPGRFRGGLGQEFAVRILSDNPIDFVPGTNDRVDHPPFGLFGGEAGRGGGMWIDGKLADRRRSQPVMRDQIVSVAIPGGGGFGPAAERDPAALARDVETGLVSEQGAARDYPKRASTSQ
jgi:N-methylhydantoinase B